MQFDIPFDAEFDTDDVGCGLTPRSIFYLEIALASLDPNPGVG